MVSPESESGGVIRRRHVTLLVGMGVVLLLPVVIVGFLLCHVVAGVLLVVIGGAGLWYTHRLTGGTSRERTPCANDK